MIFLIEISSDFKKSIQPTKFEIIPKKNKKNNGGSHASQKEKKESNSTQGPH